VRHESDSDAGLRIALRIIGWIVTALWAGTWTSMGLMTALAYSGSAGAVFLVLGCLPCLPFWVTEVRRFRAGRQAAALDVRHGPAPQGSAAEQAETERLERLPESIRDQWRQLEHARDLVIGFAEDGWVERAALLHVDDHMAHLERLLEADASVERLGGGPSTTLRGQVEELRALLVALADEAVEHQASLASDDPVPVTLAEARERLRTTTAAYRELRRPEAARDLQQPG
jgi:hypothetical protein